MLQKRETETQEWVNVCFRLYPTRPDSAAARGKRVPASFLLKSLLHSAVSVLFRMDIREIARRARVSTATVSRAINHIPTVDPQLAKRVWRVVDELGYFPNTQAR